MKRKSENALRILLVDDHLVVRMGLSAIISLQDDMTVVGEADNGLSGLDIARKRRPDVIIMDLMMPAMGGVEATEKIRAELPETKILVLTTYGSSEDTRAALDAGAAGALVKDSSQDDILKAIRLIAKGERILSPEIASSLNHAETRNPLSDRQLEILTLASKGFNNREIARLAHIGPDCVKAHLKSIFARLGASSRTEAVAIALKKNLLKV